MADKILNRTIRPSSRHPKSLSYKLDTSRVGLSDRLIVDVDHESEEFFRRVWFAGEDLAGRRSIHFQVTGTNPTGISWSIAPSAVIPDPIEITLDPSWFEMGYYVYIVVITNQRQHYFYVGMTGDRKHLTARSPFYRMSGHFSLSKKSTENQIVRFLRKKWPNTDPSNLLSKLRIKYYAYPMASFVNGDTLKHHQKRKFAEMIEACLIKQLKETFGRESVVNISPGRRRCDDDIVEIAQALGGDLVSRLRKSQ